MYDINANNSCTFQYRYSVGFDSCLYLHGESLRITLLICTISIFALLIILFLMLITAKKLLPKLIKKEHGTIHSFLSKSDIVQDKSIQNTEKLYSHSSKESYRSQSRSQQSKTMS